MPGDVRFGTRVAPLACHPAFFLAKFALRPHKKQFLGPIFGFDFGLFALKNQFVFSLSKS
jgi:hypothetical protein